MNNEKNVEKGILAYVSRYVVPFYFSYHRVGYEKIRQHFLEKPEKNWKEEGFWNIQYPIPGTIPRSDIYPFLYNLLDENNKYNKHANIGTSLVYNSENPLFEAVYSFNDKKYDFYCVRAGMLLFRNGLGFLWYDIRFGNKNKDCLELDLDAYMTFQSKLREFELSSSTNIILAKKPADSENKPFCIGEWIYDLLDISETKIEFWEFKSKTINEAGNKIKLPKRALLYQYLFINETNRDFRVEMTYRIGHGYNMKFNKPSDLEKQIYEPFGNSSVGCFTEGFVYVVSNIDTDDFFFSNHFIDKYLKDYFLIYIILLYQSYSCMHYSRLLLKLPGDVQFISEDVQRVTGKTKPIDFLEDIAKQIDLFLVKSIYTSVSNVGHQNETYLYGKKALHVEEDIVSLTMGLNALKQIEHEQEEKQLELLKEQEEERRSIQDRKNNYILLIFEVLAFTSISLDSMNLLTWFWEFFKHGYNHSVLEWLSLGIVLIIGLFALGILIYIKKDLRNDKYTASKGDNYE